MLFRLLSKLYEHLRHHHHETRLRRLTGVLGDAKMTSPFIERLAGNDSVRSEADKTKKGKG